MSDHQKKEILKMISSDFKKFYTMKNSNDLSGFILVFIILFFKILLIYSGMNVMQNYPNCSVAKINKTQETLRPSFHHAHIALH